MLKGHSCKTTNVSAVKPAGSNILKTYIFVFGVKFEDLHHAAAAC